MASGTALVGLLLGSVACAGPSAPAAVGTPLPAHQPLEMRGLSVTVDDVSPAGMNTDGTQRYVETYTVANPAGRPEPKCFRKGDQVLFADGRTYPADTVATVGLSDSGLLQILNGGDTQQGKIVFDIPAGAKVTGAGVHVDNALWRINLAT